MKDLFLADKPEIEKNAEMGDVYMSQDPTKWVKQIISIFLQQFPYLQEQPLSVSWRKKNPDEGYAIGYLNVLNGAVPVIIEEFTLKPMDVLFTAEGVAIPLHDEFVQELMSDPTAFAGLRQSNKKSNEQLFNSSMQFSPVTEYGSQTGSGTTRDAVKVASVIDNVSYVHKDDAIRLIKELKDERVKTAYEDNDTIDFFEKVADKAKNNTKEAQLEDYLRNLEIDRQMVYEDKLGNKFVKQANSRVDKTWETRLSDVEAHELDKVIANDKKTQKPEKITKEAQFAVELPDEGDYGRFIHQNFQSDEFEVTSIEKVASQPKVNKFPVFGNENKELRISEDKNWEITEKTASLDPDFEKIAGDEPKIGDWGCFITEKTASEPFEVTGMQKGTRPGDFIINGETTLHKYAFYPIKTTNDGFEQHESGANGHFYVPGNAKFVKLAEKDDRMKDLRDFEAKIKIEGLNGFNKVAFYGSDDIEEPKKLENGENGYILPIKDSFFAAKKEEGYEKTANLDVFDNHEVYRDKSGLYNLRGPEFAKYAQSNPVRNLKREDAKWAVIHCGGTEEDLNKIASLRYNRTAELEGQMDAPEPVSKLDKALEKTYNGLKDEGRLKIAKDLVKEAAYIRDKRVVDAVLSLSLLRKRNVQEYLAVLPTYEMVLAELAKLLIASRMGLANTNPDAIKNAMDAMTDVVLQLSRLQSSIKEVK